MKIFKIRGKNFKEIVGTVVKSIQEGKIVVCPTDTVYGLIADATNKGAIEKVFKIKKRPKEKPIPIFVKDLKMAKNFAEINKNQEQFLRKIWPGKVTVILRPRRKFPKGIGKPKKEIGLRIPDCEIINRLLSIINRPPERQRRGKKKINLLRPLTGTSANISGKPPSTKIKEVISQFKNQKHQPDLVIDAGNLKSSKSSTVLDLTVSPPKILRP